MMKPSVLSPLMLRAVAIAAVAIAAVAIAAMVSVGAGSARAAESGLECALSASTDFTQHKWKLFQALPNPFSPPVEYTIAQHRLIENFCLRYARCFFDDASGWAYRSTFATCVERQSKNG